MKKNKKVKIPVYDEYKANEIIRIQKKESNFVILDKTFINDPRLSFKAKGILTYLLSKPDNWTIRIKDLMNHSQDGEHSIYSGLNELKACGYYKRQPVRIGNRIAYWENIIYELPQEDLQAKKEEKKETKKDIKNNAKKAKKEEKKDPKHTVESASFLLCGFLDQDFLDQGFLDQENYVHNKNKINEKDLYQGCESIDQSVPKIEIEIKEPVDTIDTIDTIKNSENISKNVADNIELDELIKEYPEREVEIRELYRILCDILNISDPEKEKQIRIAKQYLNINIVKKEFQSIRKNHIIYVLESLKDRNIKINSTNYYITTLFNSVRTIEFYKKPSQKPVQTQTNSDGFDVDVFLEKRIRQVLKF